MKAVIINIGSELLRGVVANLNLQELSKILFIKGITVKKNTVLPDDKDIIVREIENYIGEIDLLIVTGGLGPTHDDVTKEAIAKALNIGLTFSESLYHSLKEKFKKYNIPETESLKKYAIIPSDSEILDNPRGIAPGLKLTVQNTTILLLPGPPSEAKEILSEFLEKFVKKELYWKYIRTYGLKENEILEKCEGELKSVESGLYPHIRGVDIFLSSNSAEFIDTISKSVINKLSKNVYTTDLKNIEEIIGDKLRNRKSTVATAESCTGGLLGNLITNVPGSSDYFVGAVVTYSNEAKINILKVPEAIIRKHGAVSKECAFYMAINARDLFKTDFGISITGIAGPTGGTPQKPVGLVYLGITTNRETYVFQRIFGGTRTEIKLKSALESLYLLNLILDGHTFPENIFKI
ncbi:MAG: CinA family nicotinamide mononucleotide deamidase-related protein [bacterium]|nr:CinA family nicotinamide mononucleotide deamidase-related protein [bacterium]